MMSALGLTGDRNAFFVSFGHTTTIARRGDPFCLTSSSAGRNAPHTPGQQDLETDGSPQLPKHKMANRRIL